MARLIDADALLERMEKRQSGLYTEYGSRDAYATGFEEGMLAVKDAPTVDAVEVVHGRWIDAREYCGDYMCSNCDALYGTNKFKYCPNCGAKMDGERKVSE